MKILFITNMYPTGNHPAYGIFVKEQIDDITAISNSDFDIYFINGREKGKWEYLKSIFMIPFAIIKKRYDIIHIHYGISALFLLFYSPRSKTFLTLHGADILENQGKKWQVFITTRILLKTDKVFILNQQMEQIARSLNINYEILPCGVNTGFFKPIKQPASAKICLLFPGDAQVQVKNFPLFIQVLAYLRNELGMDVDYQEMKGLTRQQVRKVINAADCLLMTSLSEGSPQVVKEALSCGLPVVSVPVGDVKLMTDAIPDCYVSASYAVEELARLVQLSLGGNRSKIREAFVKKGVYDNFSVAHRILNNYKQKT